MSSDELKPSHKMWRREVKKLRRQKIRRVRAEQRDAATAAEVVSDPDAKIRAAIQAAALRCVELEKRDEQNRIWMEKEAEAQRQFLKEKRHREAIEIKKELERQRIKQEFEIEQRALEKLREEKMRIAEEQRQAGELLRQRIDAYIDGQDDMPDELNQSHDTNPGKPSCSFFTKTGACRFGKLCSNNHKTPGISRFLVIPNFFTHIRLEQANRTEYGADILLEVGDVEFFQCYSEFFADVVAEFEAIGALEQFKCCYNVAKHLRGNVYVEFKEIRDSLKAYRRMNGRFYGGRQLSVAFCAPLVWTAAICGLAAKSRCIKGVTCNFLHAFQNPGNRFPIRWSKPRIPYPALSVTVSPTEAKHLASWNDNENDADHDLAQPVAKTRDEWRWSASPEHITLAPAEKCARSTLSSAHSSDRIRSLVSRRHKHRRSPKRRDSKRNRSRHRSEKTSGHRERRRH